MKFVALHIIYLERTMIEVMESALQKAAGEGMDEFIQVFTDKYKEVIPSHLSEPSRKPERPSSTGFMTGNYS